MKKRIPSLTSNFATLADEGAYFVDKTSFIEKLEGINFKYIFFLRPRRFGKSLTLSMLEYYYGIQHKGRFDELFGQYFIGKPENATPRRNSYYILKFNFSGIKARSSEDIKTEFYSEVRSQILSFLDTYSIGSIAERSVFLSDGSLRDPLSDLFTIFMQYVPRGKVYLLIDEYDKYLNGLFDSSSETLEKTFISLAWVKTFYAIIKIYMGEGIIDRFFATGTIPVTLDGMTSGFNVGHNITLDDKFHNMAGFTEAELRGMIENTIFEEDKFDIDAVIADMRAWYNGSRFSREAGERLYNPQMVITFLSNFSRNFSYPDEMADINVTSDYKKIANILDLLNAGESDSIIQEILNSDSISEKLTIQFNFELPYTRIEAISLLFYNGLLTIQGNRFQFFDFVIPNYVIKVMYWEYFRYLFEARHKIQYDSIPIRDSLIEMSESGKIMRLVAYVHSILKNLSNRDLQKFSEKNIKMIFMTLLMGNNAYFVKSEHENAEGYADLLLVPTKLNPGTDNFLLELKYLKKSSKETLETEKNKAIEQVRKYKSELEAEGIVCKTYAIIFVGKTGYELVEAV